jgi:hypothetical protein
MEKIVIECGAQTIDWLGDQVIDWANAGTTYSISGTKGQINRYHSGFKCDGSISSADGTYAFIYQKLGTKGILLKKGEILREINRSYYCADVHEFPAAFIGYKGKTFLAHCPNKYCQLDFEDVESGVVVTNVQERNPSDVFHSRLEVSPGNEYLISKGWLWHPLDWTQVYKIDDCFANPFVLDKLNFQSPDVGVEICSASFISGSKVLIGSSDEIVDDQKIALLPPKSFATWNLESNKISNAITPSFEFGNLFAVNERFSWDLYQYPKIIDLTTGIIVDKEEGVFSGDQRSSIHPKTSPSFALSKTKNQLAILNDGKIVILLPSIPK